MRPSVHDTIAVVLAGGRGTRLRPLTDDECKPALPFGGQSRTIDFSLSNCMHSGIRRVGVATQYRPETLVRHLHTAWTPIASRFGACIRNWPAQGGTVQGGYCGTADAVHKNRQAIADSKARFVLILAGDHVYDMDYAALLAEHVARDAGVTVGCIEVPLAEAREFGVMSVDATGRIRQFQEKPVNPTSVPGNPRHALASMGIYVFDAALLLRVLADDARAVTSSHDFGRDIIPGLIDTARVFGYRLPADAATGRGYWRDIGTLTAYWQAHMELLDSGSAIIKRQPSWPLLTAPGIVPDTSTAAAPRAPLRRNAITAPGSSADQAFIVRSVLGAQVQVGRHSCVRNSVILPGAVIGRRCYIGNAIVAAGCHVPDNTVIDAAARHAGCSAAGVEPIGGPIGERFGEPFGEPIIVTTESVAAWCRAKIRGPRRRTEPQGAPEQQYA